ncbi:unnamed protein product [Rhizoctonia solani]|uniref:Transmembrane protein n=3 Tax=Rhizoctonia solani TaxID=456999 RepID=A0A8H3A8E5_9AGAM|nr:transmembrane protein, putative [Rhizoctonia solani AG-3 Rhs1AP]KEP53545.1 putative transmembrane protein [Rhizoctonia solani 123E]CAE6415272.1 unnamed protein product [Rhizoctonia solani]
MSSVFESISGSVYGVRSMPSSIASSPHSAPALPSPPTSPNLHGVSPPDSPSSLGSFPSALSAMGSMWSLDEVNMGRREDELVAFSSQEHPESNHHLVIPSLALGPSLMPTPPPPESDAAYGEALGNVRILVLGGERSLADNLLMRSPQVVHIHGWDRPSGNVTACLEASTILADRERNVRLTVVPSYDPRDNEATKRAVSQVLQTLHTSFQTLHQQLHPARAPGPEFTAMLASHRTPLVTAVVLVVSEPMTAKEHDIISSIVLHVPVITLPHPSKRRLPHPTRPQTRSNSQTGLDAHLLAPPPLNRNATQRPYGHERGRTTLRRSHTHASPPFAAVSPPFAPYHSASPPFAPMTASPPFLPPREYVLHLNSVSELAYVLFHNPRALAGLRDAAAARFIAWREREHNPALSPQTQIATRESRPAAGLFGFEDPEAGSDLELFQSSSDEDDMIIMRTLWKLNPHEASAGGGATIRPGATREPLPSFGTTPSLGGASPSPPQHPSSQTRISPSTRSTHRKYPNLGSVSSNPRVRRSTKGKAAALERSVYHDPLHVPSLVALALSVLPQMIGRLLGFTRSRNHKPKRGHIQSGDEKDDGEGKGWSGMSVLLRVGAACAATFCAGWVCGVWMA